MMDKKKIFIADDDEACLVLKKILISRGFDVQATQNPKEVMPMIKIFKPDLVLLDLIMPDLGGFEICEMMNNDSQTQNVPVIIISGLGDLADIKKSYRSGVVSYFVKPFQIEDLIKEINKILSYKEEIL